MHKRGSYIGRMLQSYRREARLRGHEWRLTREEFSAIVQSACHYCGARGQTRAYSLWRANLNRSVRRLSKERVNGIDRVANGKGYTLENSVACCARCNSMKSDLTLRKFLNHVLKIVRRAS